MLSLSPSVHPLSIEEIDSTAAGFKDDLQREANRAVRRHDSPRALAALEGIEYIEKFVYTLKLRAGSRLGMPLRARPIRLPRAQRQQRGVL
jgi:hypothetical protein